MTHYATGRVISADGTVIGFRRLGNGPPVVLVHGGMQAAQDLMKLADALSAEFDVVVPDRRGRGLSGPYNGAIDDEVADVQAVVEQTAASRVFGLSSGALLALRTAARTPTVTRVALYEPPLSTNGSVPTSWTAAFERQIAAGDSTGALITVLKGLRIDPAMQRIPSFALRLVFTMLARRSRPDDVPLDELVPTMHYDMQLVRQLEDSAGDYANLHAEVLLLGGTKSPDYLTAALDELETRLPNRRRVTFDGIGHTAPADDGAPERVAAELGEFFRESADD
ncbi:alpha/beta fold hydrolase [Spelaeicoccus albus]|uniref:Pimeloyl-ACP methyl ester carboxylesterase n=1 Tax=Spelaeicoccus albus TaxID=1280376 RepID=A0A7Z0D587_9MICO|nr:alpha/beta hydrolase [Spelaeicoccus albus]NYI69061.1 pimeloyl-ACP methyl ester carboxylesterase [Spelaeicoccus albus]